MTSQGRSKSKARFDEALAAHQAGDLAAARRSYEALLRSDPRHFGATHMLGVVNAQEEQLEAARSLLKRAVQLDMCSAEARYNLGVVEARFGETASARTEYERALNIDSRHLKARFNLARLLIDAGDLAAAEAHLRTLLEQDPRYPGASRNLGGALKELRRYPEAIASYRKALELTPEDPNLMSDISAALSGMRLAPEAEKWASIALRLKPDLSAALNNLGVARRLMDDIDGAMEQFRLSTESDPLNVAAIVNRASLLVRFDRDIDVAGELTRRALELDPHNHTAHVIQGSLLATDGEFREALEAFERSLPFLNPLDREVFFPMYLFFLSHSPDKTAEEVAAIHRSLGAALTAELTPLVREASSFANERDPQRPLRVGFVSGDLRNHAVLHFVEPTLQGLDRTQFIPVAYSTLAKEDNVTPWAKTLFAGWRDVARFSEEELREQVIADSIDILVDLSGYTALNRLRTFAMRAAPVQASWIGYPNTTGLKSMDYYFGDAAFTPPATDALFTEKLVRLPVVAGFAPYPDLPPLAEPPCIRKGHITFGTFNRRLKLTGEVLDTWAAILRALPDAHFIFAAIDRQREIATLQAQLKARGVSADRLSFLRRAPSAEYLRRHEDMDMILDAFPYSGGTTTRHALWMGVPTLTCTGPSVPQNQGANFLIDVGLSQLVVDSPAAMVERAIELSRDPQALRHMRLGMRDRLDASGQRDIAALGAAFGKALRHMWTQWCAGAAPAAFEVSND
ncbi:tetratricopeptide repeat protein [Niveibacterium sp. SC-1]|uniref:O-linked N-acetylglucosamine transferase, SPINDLY family protein n=1 Tax=Niveibacterium sp. SC-1 TaxID=3135646 RepID=UPI00311D5138